MLLNVARHQHLAAGVATVADCTDALVDLMQMFRDKKSVFILACELLSRLVNASSTVKEVCNTAVYRKRLDGVLHIIERKHRLEVRVRTVSARSSVKSKIASPVPTFKQYEGKDYKHIAPIHCIEHLIELLKPLEEQGKADENMWRDVASKSGSSDSAEGSLLSPLSSLLFRKRLSVSFDTQA